MKWLLTVAAMLLLVPSSADAQRTLREMVRERQGPINHLIMSDAAPRTFQRLLEVSDIIVRGTVGQAAARLSDDETTIYTDYELHSVQHLRPADAVLTSRPGMGPPPVTVTVQGGVVTLEGHRVEVLYRNLPTLEQGLDAVFFLTQRGDETHVALGDAGVFEVREGEAIAVGTSTGLPAADRRRSLNELQADIAATSPPPRE